MASPDGVYGALAELGAYAEIMLPLVTATMIVPLQDYKDAYPALQYLHACSPVSRRCATEQLVCSRAAWSEGRYWSILAYALSHQDQAHLDSNILRLCWYGRCLYACTGSGCVVYLVFFTSVGASAYLATHQDGRTILAAVSYLVPRNPFPSDWKTLHEWYNHQSSRTPAAVSYLVPRNPFPSDWKTLHEWYNHQSSDLVHATTQALGRVVTYRGASSGVFGLMGAVLMVELKKCRKLGRQLKALARERTFENLWAALEGVGSASKSPVCCGLYVRAPPLSLTQLRPPTLGNVCVIVKSICGQYNGGLHHVVGFLVGGLTCAVLRTVWVH